MSLTNIMIYFQTKDFMLPSNGSHGRHLHLDLMCKNYYFVVKNRKVNERMEMEQRLS